MDVWVLVPLAAILMWGLRGYSMRGRGRDRGGVQELRDEVRALRAEVDRLREGDTNERVEGRLLELEERVDFAERLLARNEPRKPAAGG